MPKRVWMRNVLSVTQSVLAAAVLYGILYITVLAYQQGSLPRITAAFYNPPTGSSPKLSSTDEIEIGTQLPTSKLKTEWINPHANWFNRPESLVVARDDYMGKRPHVDTVANLTRLVYECRGSYENIERMPYVHDCLKYLENGENEYFYMPPRDKRASEQSPSQSEYLNSDGHNNTLTSYPTYKSGSKHSVGRCNGPIIPYHVYWTGPATWRVELFLKSHFYTQNIPCVRLWIWLDGDREPDAVQKMLNHDLLFKKFLPFVQRGDIVLKTWKFPSRIPLPKTDNTDGLGYYKNPGKPNSKNETIVAKGLIRDSNNQEWLVLTEKQMTFLPVAVSDAVRFIVLHMYGGVYLDMDVIMLRDMRPLLIGNDHSFAERWGGHSSPGDYNTAIMSLSANSSLSSYLLRGGVRMGLNFHPRVIGVMAVKDRRNQEFHMLETAVFDPIWTEFNWGRLGKCTVPCFHDYGQVFKGGNTAFPLKDEWEAYDGKQLKLIPHEEGGHFWELKRHTDSELLAVATLEDGSTKTYERNKLRKFEYHIKQDNYPPTNRTLENFFRGAWTYHVHNQWSRNPEPSSWLNVLQRAQDVHDVETALNSKLTSSVLTLDVKGAFDGVLPGRLVRRLREQGWPDNVVRWVTSFVTNRTVRIRLDGSSGPIIKVLCGLLKARRHRQSLLCFTSLPFSSWVRLKTDLALLFRDLQEALNWGREEGITFDPGKYELLHFSRRRADQDPRLTPHVTTGLITISENLSHPYTSWLGILFDKKLSFKWHVRSLASKALKVSNALSSLGNTVRDVLAHLLRQAAVACVLPIAYYGSETWWPGRSRLGPRGRISNRVDSLLQLLDKVVLKSARAILPVYRTTPLAALHREAGLPPSEISLNGRTTAATARLRHLDPRHPLLRRANRVTFLNHPTSLATY
ncbi:hypothetical protein K3495_g7626 [Podosphaera aphanis]|nr:hypothetical protein K3495_g7626 [Podosphaera aphanis]